MAKYSENSGNSMEDAIFISEAQNEQEGVQAEYSYLKEILGERDKDWKLKLQSLHSKDGHFYDKMLIEFPDGTEKAYYFDITGFFGKY
ncbi:MAG: hypothetical protein EU547_02235 [Promethearchaeota archaeon]|nr:MAG: hypothetical protein EU547_02235 [Candidatus Lokiarchaeota archaeon]